MTSNIAKKLLRVALIGTPNAGKSTLLNRLIGVEVSSVSKKVHTTRRNLLAVSTHNETQIEYYDTPGFVDRKHIQKHNLESFMFDEPRAASDKCDLIAVVIDAVNKREQNKINRGILEVLHDHQDKKSILILNKVDLVPYKRLLIDIGIKLTSGSLNGEKSPRQIDSSQLRDESKVEGGYNNFSQIFSISALMNDGVEELRNYLISVAAPVDQWPHSQDFLTNQKTVELVNEIIRGRVLEYVDEDVPYVLKFNYTRCTYDESGSLLINLSLVCPQKYMIPKVLGPKGVHIFRVVEESKHAISNVLCCDVKLTIAVE